MEKLIDFILNDPNISDRFKSGVLNYLSKKGGTK